MDTLTELLPAFMWLLWVAIVITLIKVDQRRRTAASAAAEAARPDDVDVTSFEDKSVTPYLVLAFLFGALVLPVYFVATRKTALGALIGVGWTVMTMVFVGGVTVGLTAALAGPAARAKLEEDAAKCMDSSSDVGKWQCKDVGSAYAHGEGVEKDVARGVELLERGCTRGDPGACARLIDLHNLPEVSPAKIEAARVEGVKQCAQARQDEKGKMPGFSSPSNISSYCDRFPGAQAETGRR